MIQLSFIWSDIKKGTLIYPYKSHGLAQVSHFYAVVFFLPFLSRSTGASAVLLNMFCQDIFEAAAPVEMHLCLKINPKMS